jgi:hypothetical protein
MTSFSEEKAAKRRFMTVGFGIDVAKPTGTKSFLVTFFQKSNCFLLALVKIITL